MVKCHYKIKLQAGSCKRLHGFSLAILNGSCFYNGIKNVIVTLHLTIKTFFRTVRYKLNFEKKG